MRKTLFYVKRRNGTEIIGRNNKPEYRNKRSAEKMAEHANSTCGFTGYEVVEAPGKMTLERIEYSATGVAMYRPVEEGETK